MLNVNRLRLQDIFKISTNSLVAKVTSAIPVLVGSLVLVGWWLGIEVLKGGFPGSPATMKVNTALCFVLCGVSLWLFFKGRVQREVRGESSFNIQNDAPYVRAACRRQTLLLACFPVRQRVEDRRSC